MNKDTETPIYIHGVNETASFETLRQILKYRRLIENILCNTIINLC